MAKLDGNGNRSVGFARADCFGWPRCPLLTAVETGPRDRDDRSAPLALRVTAVGAQSAEAAVDELSRAVQEALAEAGIGRAEEVERRTEQTRGFEILAICEFVITLVQTAESVSKIVNALRRLSARLSEMRQQVRVSLGGVDLVLEDSSEDQLRRIVTALAGGQDEPAVQARRALVVANSRYDDPAFARLRSPTHDAEALARVLGDPAIGGFDVDLLIDADERTIRRGIAAFFTDRDRDDLLLLHFSCHGVKDVAGRLYFAARDTELAMLAATGVPAAFVNDVLAHSPVRRVIIVLDCCYSGAFARGDAVRSGNEVHVGEAFTAGSGRIVLTASSATEYAFEGGDLARSEGRPSVFTSALVRGLETGEADLDGDGEIVVDELYDYVYRAVRANVPEQRPMKWGFGVEGGSPVIARSVRPVTLPADILADIGSERVAVRLEAVSELARIGAKGAPALRAAARETLARLADGDDSERVRQAASTALGKGSGPAPNLPRVAAPASTETLTPVETPTPTASTKPTKHTKHTTPTTAAAPSTLAAPATVATLSNDQHTSGALISRWAQPVGLVMLLLGVALPWGRLTGHGEDALYAPNEFWAMTTVAEGLAIACYAAVLLVAATMAWRWRSGMAWRVLCVAVAAGAASALTVASHPALTGGIPIEKLVSQWNYFQSAFGFTFNTSLPAVLLTLAGAWLLALAPRPTARGHTAVVPATVRLLTTRILAAMAACLVISNAVIMMSRAGGWAGLNRSLAYFSGGDVPPWAVLPTGLLLVIVCVELAVFGGTGGHQRWLRPASVLILLGYAVVLGEGSAYLYWLGNGYGVVPWMAIAPVALAAVATSLAHSAQDSQRGSAVSR